MRLDDFREKLTNHNNRVVLLLLLCSQYFPAKQDPGTRHQVRIYINRLGTFFCPCALCCVVWWWMSQRLETIRILYEAYLGVVLEA